MSEGIEEEFQGISMGKFKPYLLINRVKEIGWELKEIRTLIDNLRSMFERELEIIKQTVDRNDEKHQEQILKMEGVMSDLGASLDELNEHLKKFEGQYSTDKSKYHGIYVGIGKTLAVILSTITVTLAVLRGLGKL